jgi:2-methylcitrate dehydratase
MAAMRRQEVRVDRNVPRERQLAWMIAELASDPAPVDQDVGEMIVNRVIDNAAVASAATDRAPVASARRQALTHPRPGGALVHGMPGEVRVHCEWAAWANAAAVRELDFHDSFFGIESCHPGDSIPSILAVAQQCGRSGADVLRGVAAAYEVQIALAKSIPLQRFNIDHIGHLGPAVAAGVGALLRLPAETIYQAVQYAAHVGFYPRQGRKGALSSWKANAPGHIGKLAIEATDRAMRGEKGPTPTYEGDQGIVAAFLGGEHSVYPVTLPQANEPKRAILETYTKQHSAGYHGQSAIDLAIRMRRRIDDFEAIESIVLHVTRRCHKVMGSGANDPEKWDPHASRETLDHSLPFVFAMALQDGEWDHERSYEPERVRRPDRVRLWRKVETREDPKWTRRYEEPESLNKDHGCRAVIRFRDGREIVEEIAVPDVHPRGAAPFGRADYVGKFRRLTEKILPEGEADRFLALAYDLPRLDAAGINQLGIRLSPDTMAVITPHGEGIF